MVLNSSKTCALLIQKFISFKIQSFARCAIVLSTFVNFGCYSARKLTCRKIHSFRTAKNVTSIFILPLILKNLENGYTFPRGIVKTLLSGQRLFFPPSTLKAFGCKDERDHEILSLKPVLHYAFNSNKSVIRHY